MKFGKKLEDEAIPEWSLKYINYKYLKKLISKIPPLEHSPDDPSVIITPLTVEEKEFLAALTVEVRKVEDFYFLQLNQNKERKDLIVRQVEKLFDVEKLKVAFENTENNFQKKKKMISSEKHPDELLEEDERGSRKLAEDSSRWKRKFSISSVNLVDQNDRAIRQSTRLQASSAHDHLLMASQGHLPTISSAKSAPGTFPDDPSSALKKSSSWTEGDFRQVQRLKGEGPLTIENEEGADLADDSGSEKSLEAKPGALKSSPAPRPAPPAPSSSSAKHSSGRMHLAMDNLRKALLELYRSLELLKEFRELNILAFKKIVKKFEKNTRRQLRETLLHKFVVTEFFNAGDELTLLFSSIEHLYELYFTEGNRSRAMKELRTIGLESLQSKQSGYENLLVGFFCGINLMFLLIIYQILCYDTNAIAPIAHHRSGAQLDVMEGMFLIYFGLGLPVLIANLVIVNMYVWDLFKINFRLVCGVSPRTSVSHYSVFVSVLATVYLSLVSVSLSGHLNRYFSPAAQVWLVLLIMLVLVSNSLRLYQSSRVWMGVLTWRIVSAPLYPTLFKDFFVADQLVSIGPFYQALGLLLDISFNGVDGLDMSGSLPFTWYIAFLPMLPFYWRAMQCIRRYVDGLKVKAGPTQLINCSRYSLGLAVLLLSTLQTVYAQEKALVYVTMAVRIAYSVFSYYWDIYMDWGLGQGRWIQATRLSPSNNPNPSPNPSGRSNDNEGGGKPGKLIVYPPWVYVFVIVTDGLTRFLWLPFSVLGLYEVKPKHVYFALGLIEVLRRFQWNFIRVEIEHIHNCEKLRVTEEVEFFHAQDLFVTADGDDHLAEQGLWHHVLGHLLGVTSLVNERIAAALQLRQRRLHRTESVPSELQDTATVHSLHSHSSQPAAPTRLPAWLEDSAQLLFKTRKRHSTIETELFAGFRQFLECFYLLAVVPHLLGAASLGYDVSAAVTATCVACCVGCVLLGLLTDMPFTVAPPLAVSVFFAASLQRSGLARPEGNAALLLAGLFLALLGLLPPVHHFLVKLLPDSIQTAIPVGLGLLTSLAAVTELGLVVRGRHMLSEMGPLSLEAVLSLAVLAVVAVLFHFRQHHIFSAAVLLGSLLGLAVGAAWPGQLAHYSPPAVVVGRGDLRDSSASLLLVGNVFLLLALLLHSLAKPLADLAGVTKPSGRVPRGNMLLLVCGLATMLSGYLSGPPVLLSAESLCAIRRGGRTGLSAVTCGLCFGLAALLSPLLAAVPTCATAPVLLMAGALMFGNARNIRWADQQEAVSSFLVLFCLLFALSALPGIALGLAVFLLVNLYTGRFGQQLRGLLSLYRDLAASRSLKAEFARAAADSDSEEAGGGGGFRDSLDAAEAADRDTPPAHHRRGHLGQGRPRPHRNSLRPDVPQIEAVDLAGLLSSHAVGADQERMRRRRSGELVAQDAAELSRPLDDPAADHRGRHSRSSSSAGDWEVGRSLHDSSEAVAAVSAERKAAPVGRPSREAGGGLLGQLGQGLRRFNRLLDDEFALEADDSESRPLVQL